MNERLMGYLLGNIIGIALIYLLIAFVNWEINFIYWPGMDIKMMYPIIVLSIIIQLIFPLNSAEKDVTK